ncbi:ShET2/EspL2 family type III secretion system effector toxin [Paracidovorax konjaci]|nr:ShET2/EspL2 family type III secretion system effector toxin [Paracidovorax konjaci]
MPKPVPYHSQKPDRSLDCLNLLVPYPSGWGWPGMVIECRHLALTWVMQAAGAGKPDYADFSSVPAIARSVQPQANALYEILMTHAPEVHMAALEDIGRFAAGQLKAMASAGAPAAKQFLFCSGGHAMALELKVKQGAEGPRFVANFYDPNITANHKRVASHDLAHVEALRVEDLVEDALAKHYFGNESAVLMVALPPGDLEALPPAPHGGTQRRLAGPTPPVDAGVIHQLLTTNMAGTLRDIAPRIAQLARRDPEAAERVLEGRSCMGLSGISKALERSSAAAVGAYIDLVASSPLPLAATVRLLTPRLADGQLGLALALRSAEPETVQAYLDGLDRHPQLNDHHRAGLLGVRGAEGRTALGQGMRTGRADNIQVLVDRIAQLDVPSRTRCVLLCTPHDGGGPCLAQALRDNAADRVAAYVEAVLASPMHAREKAYVLGAGLPAGELLAQARSHDARQALHAYRSAIEQSTLPAREKSLLLG